MSRHAFLERLWVRAASLVVASLLMFVMFNASPLRLDPKFATTPSNRLDAQVQTVILEFTRNAVSEIRQRQEAEDRWFNYKFILIGSLLGAFLARFAIGGGVGSDTDAQLGEVISSNATCCALAFATVVALIIDIHVRGSITVINQLGSWIANFAEPALIQGEPNGFRPWEAFLRDSGGMHNDPFYTFAYWPNLHISTLVIYVIYLGVLQEVSLKGGPENRSVTLLAFAFTLVQVTLLFFAWMSHTAPGAFEFQAIPFVDHWYPANLSGFFYIVPWALNTVCGLPYLWHPYRRSSTSLNDVASSKPE